MIRLCITPVLARARERAQEHARRRARRPEGSSQDQFRRGPSGHFLPFSRSELFVQHGRAEENDGEETVGQKAGVSPVFGRLQRWTGQPMALSLPLSSKRRR